MGHEQVATRISTVSLVIVLGGGFIATYLFSYNGMAAVTGLVLAGKGLISYAFARRRLPEIRPLSVI
jgi:O-antigen/teichoic acid export membrane protein